MSLSSNSKYANKASFSSGSLGVIRSRTNKFMELKKKCLEDNLHFETGSSLNDNGKTSLLGKKVDKIDKHSSTTKLTELQSFKKDNSRRYIDIFNNTNLLYEELRQNFITLKQEQQKRIIPKFDEEENKRIDKNIKSLVVTMTDKVRLADKNINDLSSIKFDSSSEEAVKENMKMNLAEKIREFSRDFKINEENYMKNYQELVGDTNTYEVEDLDGSTNYSSNSKKKDFLQLSVDSSEIIIKQRDEEISILLNSITALAGVFKDLQTLVHHQGTILDRIDYNIETAGQNIKHAHKDLIKTEKMMKTNCYRNSMLVIIILIFIMGVLLVLKFTS